MSTKELPEGRASLEHLLQYTDRHVADLEPLRQQANCAADYACEMLVDGDLADHCMGDAVIKVLSQRLVDGMPPNQLLSNYLETSRPLPSKVNKEERQKLEELVKKGVATQTQREEHGILVAIRIAEHVGAINQYVDCVHAIHGGLVEKLAKREFVAKDDADPTGEKTRKGRKKPNKPPNPHRFRVANLYDLVQRALKVRGRRAAARESLSIDNQFVQLRSRGRCSDKVENRLEETFRSRPHAL